MPFDLPVNWRALLAAACFGAAGTVLAGPSFEEAAPPDRPDCEIWLSAGEAETNMPSQSSTEAYSSRIVYLLSKESPTIDGYYLGFSFSIPSQGTYELWLASSLPGANWVSPLKFYLDDEEIFPQQPLSRGQKTWGIANAVCWNNFGTLDLKPGDHQLRIVTTEKRKMDEYYSFVLDALALVRTSP